MQLHATPAHPLSMHIHATLCNLCVPRSMHIRATPAHPLSMHIHAAPAPSLLHQCAIPRPHDHLPSRSNTRMRCPAAFLACCATQQTLVRFLAARKWVYVDARNALANHVAWRKQNFPNGPLKESDVSWLAKDHRT
eukprot:362000-Chlamydomonas_euryale.AAC.9